MSDGEEVDAALGLKMISLRLPEQLVEDFKVIAAITNSPYQAVMRNCLVDHAHAALTAAGREYLTRKAKKMKSADRPC